MPTRVIYCHLPGHGIIEPIFRRHESSWTLASPGRNALFIGFIITFAEMKNAWSIFDALFIHDNVIKLKHFPRCWPFVSGIHRSPVNSPHKGQWRGALLFSLSCVWINEWGNIRETGDLRRHRAHYDVIVMSISASWQLDKGKAVVHSVYILERINQRLVQS